MSKSRKGAAKRIAVARTKAPVYAAVKSDDSDVAELIRDVHTSFEAFKAENDKRLKQVEKGREDAVTAEHVNRINKHIDDVQAQLEAVNDRLTALDVSAAGTAPDAEAERYRAAFSGWARRGRGEEEIEALGRKVRADISTDSNPDGGYVVPETLERAIDRVTGTASAIRQVARVLSISTASWVKLHNLGGATSGWVAEKASRSSTSTPTLSRLNFPTFELYAMPASTQTALDDASLNIEQWLADEIGIAFAEKEGDAFINGDGATAPEGLMTATKVADASWAWGKTGFVVSGAAATFASSNPTDNFVDLQQALAVRYQPNATWLMNRTVQGLIRKFKDGQGNYIWQPGATAGTPNQLLGRPVVTDDNMPDVGSNTYPVAYGDFRRGYVVLDRVGIRVLRDPFTSKPNVLFYTTKRVGGGIMDFEAFKVMKCST